MVWGEGKIVVREMTVRERQRRGRDEFEGEKVGRYKDSREDEMVMKERECETNDEEEVMMRMKG